MLHLKRLDEISEAAIFALTTDGVTEGQHIDFKRAFDLEPVKAKRELCRDVSSFANASGGDLVIGVDEKDGVATAVPGVESKNIEELERQVRDICLAHIDPPITGIRVKRVSLNTGREVLIIRVPKTWNSPHMVLIENEHVCWIRDQSGKRQMTIPDLKHAFAFSEGAAEKMKRFRLERLGNIVAGETPLPLFSPRCLVVHMMPLISFTSSYNIDLNLISDVDLPPVWCGSWNSTFTLEGRIGYDPSRSELTTSYFLAFRTGVVEAVESSCLEPAQSGELAGKRFFSPSEGGMMAEGVQSALNLYRKLSVPTPIIGAVSFTGVKGYTMQPDARYRMFRRLQQPLVRDILNLPEFLIEDLNTPAHKLIERTLDVWWQSCGYPGRPQANA